MMRLVHAVLVGTIAVGADRMACFGGVFHGADDTEAGRVAGPDRYAQGARRHGRQTDRQAAVGQIAGPGDGDDEQRVRSALAKSAGTGMKSLRSLAGGAHLMQLDQPMTVTEARVVAARSVAGPGRRVCRAECPLQEDGDAERAALPQWQWNLFAPTSTYTGTISGGATLAATAVGGSNLPRPGT